jgi:methionine-S-sulfoxide reductase
MKTTLLIATFAGGCFWCMEYPFDQLEGVVKTVVGYTGGTVTNPTYEEVSTGQSGHAEAVQIYYNPKVISFEKLVDTFWKNINPTDPSGQFVDRGPQYRAEIFYHSEEQKRMAEMSKAKLEASGKFDKPIVTPITPAGEFYPAEEYHQDYYRKNPTRYKMYRFGSGRDDFLEKTWDKK